jgi:hypothetical protein
MVDTFQLAKAGSIHSARATVWFLLVLVERQIVDKETAHGVTGGFAFGSSLFTSEHNSFSFRTTFVYYAVFFASDRN